MFNYNIKQKSYKLGKYTIGGDPREAPTAVIGTIFYLRQKNIFKDEAKGEIIKDFAEKLIKDQEELADKTGLVPGLDVILSYEASIKPILDFVIDITDMPIVLDAPTYDVKVKAVEYVKEAGVQERIIYNSITPESSDEEFELLVNSKIQNFILLGMESKKWTTQARIEVIDSLVEKAKSFDFAQHNFIIDTAVLDITSLGLAMNAMHEVKNKYGFPVGSGAHNAVDTWKNLKLKFGDIKKYTSVVASTITLGAGADFILYGPVQHANIIYPNIAFIKAAHSQLLFDEGRMAPISHPVFKIG
ncbi:MAG: tetrahydromethanopterin S-methyltransferase subunit H [Candidatus Lokiarchaeota archaeon]|nr:tetrahydromethanopterin S-methyltransferase subunit H [Candidatus Lokiarchaeota archaeon]